MPQYEIRDTETGESTPPLRARSAADGVRLHLGLPQDSRIEIEAGHDFEKLSGWRDVKVNGRVVAQVREFHRMKFRRA